VEGYRRTRAPQGHQRCPAAGDRNLKHEVSWCIPISIHNLQEAATKNMTESLKTYDVPSLVRGDQQVDSLSMTFYAQSLRFNLVHAIPLLDRRRFDRAIRVVRSAPLGPVALRSLFVIFDRNVQSVAGIHDKVMTRDRLWHNGVACVITCCAR
jgi:hypothetical protein